MDNPPIQILEIFLLGKFRARVNGDSIEKRLWTRRSSKQLIKLLALEPNHELHREQLIELLWADQYSKTLTNNLDKAIHAARRILEPNLEKASDSQFIVTQKHQVRLCAPGGSLFIDALEFERLAAKAIKSEDLSECERALDLYQGDLLTEDLYEEWAASRREHLRLLHRKLATKMAAMYAAQEHLERSIKLLKDLSLSDPTDERVHQDLIRLYAQTGSKYQALKQYEICKKALVGIGLEPEAETIEIKTQVERGSIAPVKLKPADTSYFTNGNHSQGDGLLKPVNAEPRIEQLTFNHGVVHSAKFTPDGHNVVCSAAWEENEFELYKIHRKSLELNPVGLYNTGVLGVSAAGEIALALDRKFLRGYTSVGTLACQHVSGGVPREMMKNVQWCDWLPGQNNSASFSDKERIAIVREIKGRNRLEYPVGNVLYETGGWISNPRFSPQGDKIAFIDHPTLADDSGAVVIINLKGEKTTLSDKWISAQGLIWNRSGDEIWFTATREGNSRAIHAVDLQGRERLIYRGIGSLTIHDLSKDGAALVTLNKTRIRILAKNSKEAKERDLSWHDWSLVRDISADGKTILFTEAGESGGAVYTVYIRKTDGSPPLRLGSGSALALSLGGQKALVNLTSSQQLALLPIGAGEAKILEPVKSNDFLYQPWACFFPDGKRILFAANERDKGTKLYVQAIGDKPVCITPDTEGVEISSPHSVSPDGKFIAIISPDKKIYLYSMASRKLIPLPQLEANYLPVRWSKDGKYIYVRERGQVPAAVFRYELNTERKQPVLDLMPADKTGVHEILRVLLTPDASSYAYSYTRELSELFIIEGLK